MGQKGGRAARSRLRRRGAQCTADPAGRQPAAVIAYDEMWTYQQARHGDKLYARLPEADLYRSDAYGVYQSWLPSDHHMVGKGGAVNWNEGP